MEQPRFEGNISDYYFKFNQWKLIEKNKKLKRDFTPYKKKSTRSKEWKRIRKNIIERDHFCINCSSTKRLEVHHIDKNRNNNESKNLLTLCYKCHSKKHENELVSRIREMI